MQVDELIRRAFPTDDPPPSEALVSDGCSFCVALRGALQGKRWDTVAVLSVCDPELPEDEWWRERLPLLNNAQRTAVATFVEWAARTLDGDEDEASLRTSAEVALRKYWGQYVSESLGAAQQGS